MTFPKPTFDSPPNATNPLHARTFEMPGGYRLWWRKHPGQPAYWTLEVRMHRGDARIMVEVPLGAEAPGLLLYTAAMLQGVAK